MMLKYPWRICAIPQVMVVLLAWNFCVAQKPFDCNGRIYRVLEEQGGSTFQEILIDRETEQADFVDLSFFNSLKINGIAYRPEDNLIYGVLLETPYVLCRIDADYKIERLADLPLPSNLLFVSGDISPDERYLVLLGYSADEKGNLLALVDLESPTYETKIMPASKTNPDEYVYCADIAFHPTLDVLFGFEHSERRLITIDINTGLIDNTSYPTTDVIDGNVPSIFFDAFGNLFGIGSDQGAFSNRNLYLLDTETGSASIYEEMSFERNQDACSCPFKVELLNRVSSRRAYPCSYLDFEFTVLNRTDRDQTDLILKDTFPDGTIIVAMDELPFLADVISSVGTNILHIQDIDLPIGKFRFRLTLEIPEGAPSQTIYNRAYLDNVILTSLTETEIILSDDPETVQPDDPTFFMIDDLIVDFAGSDSVVCEGQSLVLSSGIEGAPAYNWSTGETSEKVTITSPGLYSVTVTTLCEEASGSFFVRSGDISVDLGDDMTVEAGTMLELHPRVSSDVPVQYFFWEEFPQNGSLSCLTCREPMAQPKEDSEFRLTVENIWGCKARDALQVKVDGVQLYIPNVFSPNGDGHNDRFFLQGQFDYQIIFLTIFDRWGNLVFENRNILANDPGAGWDGTLESRFLNPGVFVWIAEIRPLDGTTQMIGGDLTLVR